MALNEVLKKTIEKQFFQLKEKEIVIENAVPVRGGDTSDAYQLVTNVGAFFLKILKDSDHPDIFEKESEGLRLLSRSNTVAIPQVIFTNSSTDIQYIVTEFITKQAPHKDFWKIFAQNLANLHRQHSPFFGFHSDNYIGPLSQSNKSHENWPTFYRSERIEPLIKKCIDQKLLDTSILTSCNLLYKQIEDIFPTEKPSLLHGDLWGGNYLSGPGGKPYLFDPSVYYGSREMDIAMTRLFGGFDRQFYWYYEDIYPLPEDWQKRIALCQLYPLLVHALIFRGGYIRQVKNIISSY